VNKFLTVIIIKSKKNLIYNLTGPTYFLL